MKVGKAAGLVLTALFPVALITCGTVRTDANPQMKERVDDRFIVEPSTRFTKESTRTAGQDPTISTKATTSESSTRIEAHSSVTITTAGIDAPYGSHLNPILEKICATPDQRKRLAGIVESYKPKIEPLRAEYKQKSKEFINDIISGQPAEVIMARQGELNNLHGVISTQYSLMRLEIRRMLSPQQCKLFEEYRLSQGWRSR